jgi:hypothetical protein
MERLVQEVIMIIYLMFEPYAQMFHRLKALLLGFNSKMKYYILSRSVFLFRQLLPNEKLVQIRKSSAFVSK